MKRSPNSPATLRCIWSTSLASSSGLRPAGRLRRDANSLSRTSSLIAPRARARTARLTLCRHRATSSNIRRVISPASRREPPVDAEILPGHVRGGVGGEEQQRPNEIRRLGHPPEGDSFRVLARELGVLVAANPARRERVHPHAVRAPEPR